MATKSTPLRSALLATGDGLTITRADNGYVLDDYSAGGHRRSIAITEAEVESSVHAWLAPTPPARTPRKR